MRHRVERRAGVPFRDVRPRNHAPRMRVPLLAFHDRDDPDVSAEQARALVDAWPRARLVRTAGLGHRAILRDRDVVRQACAFLAEPGASPAYDGPRRPVALSSASSSASATAATQYGKPRNSR